MQESQIVERVHKNPQKSTSEGFSELWARMTRNQKRFAVAMMTCETKKEAAEAVGVKPNTSYKWSAIVDRAIELMQTDIQGSTLEILRSEANRAAMVKVAGLDSESEKIRQESSGEILDRILGKAKQPQEIETGPKLTDVLRALPDGLREQVHRGLANAIQR